MIFFAPVNTGFITNGQPDQRFINFYESRSSADLHCSIVGNVVVPKGYGSNTSTPIITKDGIWADIAGKIKDRGTIPGIQLASAWKGYAGLKTFLASERNAVIAEGRALVAAMSQQDIKDTLSSFRAGAAIAVMHGFKHIQIHAAHGYLLSLLIDRRISDSADYVISEMNSLAKELCMQGIETSIRISLKTGDDVFDQTGAVEFQDEIASLPFDFVDLSSGFYNLDKRLIYPTKPEFVTARISDSLRVAIRHPNRQFIFSGRVQLQNLNNLPSNMHPGICRDLIANPNFLREPDRGCSNRNKCHYYSRGEAHITCGKW